MGNLNSLQAFDKLRHLMLSLILTLVQERTPSVFPLARRRTPWMNRNHLESPPPDAGGDRGGLIWIDQNISTPVTASYESSCSSSFKFHDEI